MIIKMISMELTNYKKAHTVHLCQAMAIHWRWQVWTLSIVFIVDRPVTGCQVNNLRFNCWHWIFVNVISGLVGIGSSCNPESSAISKCYAGGPSPGFVHCQGQWWYAIVVELRTGRQWFPGRSRITATNKKCMTTIQEAA